MSIDLPGQIVGAIGRAIAPVLTPIINGIRINGDPWPGLWKEEEVSVLPKSTNPDSLDGCRGISCTSILAKLTETYMIDMLREEVTVSDTQFGGLPGSGTDHMLCELTTRLMEDMDDGRGVATVMTIDYQKAFNRMEHNLSLIHI